MKKVLVIIIGFCFACAVNVHARNGWPGEERIALPQAQMASTSSGLVSMQAHEHLMNAYYTSYSGTYSVEENISDSYKVGPRRVGHDTPTEPPGVPVGDGMLVLSCLAVLYVIYKRVRGLVVREKMTKCLNRK